MLERLRYAPWWAWALLTGVPFGLAMWFATTEGGSDRRSGAAVAGAVVAGLLYGLIMAAFGTWIRRRYRSRLSAAAGRPLRPSEELDLTRAAIGGSPPADPGERQAALALARRMLADQERQRAWVPPFYLVVILLAGALALTGSAWFWLVAIMFAALLVAWVVSLRRLRRQVQLLEERPG